MSKTFFESLNPKSALITGVVGGFLVICAIGFFILLGVMFNGEATAEKVDKIEGGASSLTIELPKTKKPSAELFIMSHCPYGLQAEKAFLPVMDLLKDEADLKIRFVNYAMHGLTEVEEQTRQLCVEEQGKLISYLDCFVLADEPQKCLAQAGVNTSKLDTCTDKLDTEYGIMDAYNDKASWLSGRFPIFSVHDELNKKYGVQGSPTLVINETRIVASGDERTQQSLTTNKIPFVLANVSRSPADYLKAICSAFENAPEECDTVLSTAAATPSFGGGTAQGGANTADCGV